ncbi:sodium glucose cotransporter 4 [Paramuricea clavata]|uniref:Sodium glucose cotransporter 4 n=2 Tax=Paramuricea clavata TaxID=317549 RepID=A0A6S7HY56_PARCT|nr:sodium glucose cotransporter 4 [Paramuricea clavata]
MVIVGCGDGDADDGHDDDGGLLVKDNVACSGAESCNREQESGMVGIMMAVMLAAVMSSLSSVYNSASTIFTIDIWQRLRPRASDREKLMIGRAIVAILVVLGLVWMPLIERGGSGKLFRYIQTILFLFGSPIMAIFIVGLVWPRANEPGALGGFLIGLLLAAARFATEYIYASPACGEPDTRPAFASIHYMYFGIILFVVTLATIIVLSLLTKPIPREELDGLTWITLKNKTALETKHQQGMSDVVISSDKGKKHQNIC